MKLTLFSLLCAICGLQGCSVVSVADAVVSVTATAVKVGAGVIGAGVDVAAAGIKSVTGSGRK